MIRRALSFVICGAAFFILVACQYSAFGEERHWEFSGWYGGGTFPNVAFDASDNGRVYLVSDVAGVWKSDDLGEKWDSINGGLDDLSVSFLEVDPLKPEVLYAGTVTGLFRSDNRGMTWSKCDTASGKISFERPGNYRSIAISEIEPGKLIAGTAGGEIYFSRDHGRSWTKIVLPEDLADVKKPISVVIFDPDGKNIYAARGKELYLCSLEDNKCRTVRRTAFDITDLVMTGKDKERIYLAGGRSLVLSKDGGASWSFSRRIPEGTVYRVVVPESGDPDRVVVAWQDGWRGGVFVSEDGGKTWNSSGGIFEFDEDSNPTRSWKNTKERLFSLKADPFNKNILFATSDWGVFKSDDGGYTWNEKIKGAANSAGSDIHITPGGVIYVATMDNGLLKSEDGGKRYKSVFPKDSYDRKKWGHVWRVETGPLDESKIIATTSPWDDDVNQVIISENSGEDFKIARKGLPKTRPKRKTVWEEGYARAISISRQGKSRIYLGIDGEDNGGLYISRNGGWKWEKSHSQPASRNIYNALAVDPLDSGRIYWGAYGENGGVYISEDGGKNWQHIFKDMEKCVDMAVSPEGVVYVVGEKQSHPAVFCSKDMGKSWFLLKEFPDPGSSDAIFVYPDDSKKLALSTVRWHAKTGTYIYWSEDGGLSWHNITGDLPIRSGVAAMALDKNNSHLYVVLYAGSVYRTKIAR